MTRSRRGGRWSSERLGRALGAAFVLAAASGCLASCSLTSDLGALECGAACDPDASAHAPQGDGSAADGAAQSDAATSPPDTGATADASNDPGKPPGITCGVAGTCDPATDVCCATPFLASCSSAASCKGTSIPCDDGFDCASGQTCCATVNGPQLTAVACSASCSGATQVIFCNQAAPACPSGTTCKTAHFASDLLGNLFASYSTCQ